MYWSEGADSGRFSRGLRQTKGSLTELGPSPPAGSCQLTKPSERLRGRLGLGARPGDGGRGERKVISREQEGGQGRRRGRGQAALCSRPRPGLISSCCRAVISARGAISGLQLGPAAQSADPPGRRSSLGSQPGYLRAFPLRPLLRGRAARGSSDTRAFRLPDGVGRLGGRHGSIFPVARSRSRTLFPLRGSRSPTPFPLGGSRSPTPFPLGVRRSRTPRP